jgi:hypothetical protein
MMDMTLLPTRPFTLSPDFEPTDDAVPLQAQINLNDWYVQVSIVSPLNHYLLADVYVEYYNGQVVVHVWNERDVDMDPTARIVLIENPRELVEEREREREERNG